MTLEEKEINNRIDTHKQRIATLVETHEPGDELYFIIDVYRNRINQLKQLKTNEVESNTEN